MCPRPYAGEHKKLGGPENTAAEDNLGRVLRQSQLAHPRANAPPTRHGLHNLDPDSVPAFNDDARHRRVILDAQVRHGRDGFDERRPRRLSLAAFRRRALHRAASEAFPRPGRLVALATLSWGSTLNAYLFEHAIARQCHSAGRRKFFKGQLGLDGFEARLYSARGEAVSVFSGRIQLPATIPWSAVPYLATVKKRWGLHHFQASYISGERKRLYTVTKSIYG